MTQKDKPTFRVSVKVNDNIPLSVVKEAIGAIGLNVNVPKNGKKILPTAVQAFFKKHIPPSNRIELANEINRRLGLGEDVIRVIRKKKK